MWSSRCIVFTNLSAGISRPVSKSQVTALVKTYVCVNLSSCFCSSCSTLLIRIVYFSFCFLAYLVCFCVSWMSCEGNSSKCSQRVAWVPMTPSTTQGHNLVVTPPPVRSDPSLPVIPPATKSFRLPVTSSWSSTTYLPHRHHLWLSCHILMSSTTDRKQQSMVDVFTESLALPTVSLL